MGRLLGGRGGWVGGLDERELSAWRGEGTYGCWVDEGVGVG